MWPDYFVDLGAIVFIVDASDKARLHEARRELDNLVQEASLSDVPILILANKIDLSTAASPDELKEALGIRVTTGQDTLQPLPDGTRPFELFMCSIRNRQGYGAGLQWLTQYL